MPNTSYALARALHETDTEATALVHLDYAWSYRHLNEQVSRAANFLRDNGIRPDQRVAILAVNGVSFAAAMLGAARTGAVVVPLNWRLSKREISEIIADAKPSFLFVQGSLRDKVAGDIPQALLPEPCENDQLAPWRESNSNFFEHHRPPDAPALQVYTSGTSGNPKGVVLTDSNLAAKVTGTRSIWELTPDCRTLLSTPLFHVGGLSWLLAGLAAGSTTVFAASSKPNDLLQHCRMDSITHAFLVPTQIRGMCDADTSEAPFPYLQSVYYGAAPMEADLLESANRLFGPVLYHLYGLSETTGAITQLSPDTPLPGSAGKPYPWVELQIRDLDDQKEAAPGIYGEVWTRSAQNCAGYFNQDEATSLLFDDEGWLRTGDGGFLDENGNLFLTDRVKDMIISGGENVLPVEVENVLRGHPAVSDVAVVGIDDRQWGQRVAAAIVPTPNTPWDEQDIITFCRQFLAPYKCPSIVRAYSELPRNATGKVLRRTIKEELS